MHQALTPEKSSDLAPIMAELAATQRQQNRLLGLIALLLAALLAVQYF